MNSFKYSPLNCHNTENTLMALFCSPCLYGINKSKMEALDGEVGTNIIPGTFTYIAILIGWQMVGIFYTGFIGHLINAVPSPDVIQCISTLCGSIGTGLYAGKLRTKIRNKYNIEGTPYYDCCIHSFAAPCALCQEANEIKYRSTIISDEQMYMPVYTAPIDIPTMKK